MVVLVPGPTDSWRSYGPMLEHLPRSIRAIAVSQRGHGDSDKPPSGYRVEDFAADLVALIDRLGVEQAVIAGHSGSCLVARRTAIDHPTRVTGLVLEASPTTLRGHEGLETFVESVASRLQDPIEPSFASSFLSDTSSAALAPELLAELTRETTKVPARVWNEMFAELLVYTDLAELDRINAPTLLLWGDADPIVTRDMQDVLAALIRQGELVIYPGVGHTPRWEEPVRFAADVAAFVERSHTERG